jgi:hypothetical protein
MEHLFPHFCCIFRDYLAYRYIPMAWRQVKVTFISVPMKSDYTNAKAYHPVSLLSFLLKPMARLVSRYIRDIVLKEYSLHQNNMPTKLENAPILTLHNVVMCTKSANEHKEIALGAFLNTAFDRTSFERHGIEPTICRWICSM